MVAILFWTCFYCLVIAVNSADSTSQVTVDCGDGIDQPSKILFIGDVRTVYAFGSGEMQCDFAEKESLGEFDVTVHYGDSGNCKFKQRAPERSIYTVTIETRKQHPMIEVLEDETYLVICNFMAWSQVEQSFGVISRFRPPIMSFNNVAERAKSTFSVYMVNILGGPLTGPLLEKRVVKLRADMTPPKVAGERAEVGFAPIQCVAQAEHGGQQLVILSDGCGTGFPWKISEGFEMNGLVGISPKFRLFKLHRKMGIKISCHFVVCEVPCDTNSCPAARLNRYKRDVELDKRVYLHGQMSTISIGMNETLPDETNGTIRRLHRVNISSIPRIIVNPSGQDTVSGKYDGKETTRIIVADDIKSNVNVVNEPAGKDQYGPEMLQKNTNERKAMLDEVYDRIDRSENRTSLFIGLSIFSSLILLTTIVLTTFILSKIHQTHQQILAIKRSS
ncbi:hypothetical protein LOTGIDRAFT_233992 [Lottia gigantea]|uniref:Vitelline envelope sperm lysin receptor C-terminal domain-containing protein n=1 Tax=Lottia gigantea TaxID=225164 RepID=V4BLY0_LOTGI|nr:hypothetical protein LOTGIDRAFT_233992 [Lottia gigantea]ESO89839.1 hypothetical protein LOTGIDRAFT_233992 [Lottia gigantea]